MPKVVILLPLSKKKGVKISLLVKKHSFSFVFSQKRHIFAREMWFENIAILDLTIKGLIVGMVASAPMGPVGVLCVQRTLNKGRIYGLVTGLGAAVSDIIYALITGLGMSFVVEFIEQPRTMYILQLIGSVLLFGFGYYTFRSRPLFIALFARFTFVVPEHPWQQALGFIAIFLGAMLWWGSLTYIIDKVRVSFDLNRIYIINRIIGVVVMVVSVLGLLSTLLGLTLY